jgi:hypothetical protein
MNQAAWRSYLALALCLGSVVWAVWMGRYTQQPLVWLIQMVAGVWFFTGLWLGDGLRHLNHGPKALYQVFREGRHTMPPLPTMMVRGGMILTAVNAVFILTLIFHLSVRW